MRPAERLARRMVIRGLARGIRRARGPQLALIRQALDHRFAAHSDEWRRDVWREAAERAARG